MSPDISTAILEVRKWQMNVWNFRGKIIAKIIINPQKYSVVKMMPYNPHRNNKQGSKTLT